MAQELSEQEANNILERIVTGWNINQITFHGGGWEIRLISPSKSEPDEVYIWASEIVVPNIERWRIKFDSLLIELGNTDEANDAFVAFHLMAVIYKHNVERAFVDSGGNLNLKFSNASSIICSANVEQIDWTWKIFDEAKTFSITCDSGPVYLSGDLHA